MLEEEQVLCLLLMQEEQVLGLLLQKLLLM